MNEGELKICLPTHPFDCVTEHFSDPMTQTIQE